MPTENTSLPTESSHSSETPQEHLHQERLTPWVTPILTTLTLDPTTPPALFHSYTRLYAASWQNNYQHTDWLEFYTELAPLLGVRPTQARQHLRYLRLAKLLNWKTDGNNRCLIRFPPSPKSENPASVVDELINHYKNTQQQLKDSIRPDLRKTPESSSTGEQAALLFGDLALHAPLEESGGLPGEGESDPKEGFRPADSSPAELRRVSLHFLRRAGVWPEVAERIASQLVENQQRGHSYLPTLADMLGWIAYCFGDQQKHNVTSPASLLANNLNANRCCPEKYCPPLVCKACGFAGGEPAYGEIYFTRGLPQVNSTL